MSERFIGVDIRKITCVFTEIDSEGNLVRRGKFGNNTEEVSDFAGSLSPSVSLVAEPVLNCLWLLDQLEPHVGSLRLARPFKVRIIAESKSKPDRYDSRMLAELLRTDFLPESYLIPKDIRELRELIRQRFSLVKNSVMFKNRIRHLLFLNGFKIRTGDIYSSRAQKEMAILYLPEITRLAIDQCRGIIKDLKAAIKSLEGPIYL